MTSIKISSPKQKNTAVVFSFLSLEKKISWKKKLEKIHQLSAEQNFVLSNETPLWWQLAKQRIQWCIFGKWVNVTHYGGSKMQETYEEINQWYHMLNNTVINLKQYVIM